MIATQASKVFHCIRSLALHQHDGATDGNLLDLYVRQKDEAAFEALVRRHGRMVLGVCRRLLGNCHDAEDAFQATFLVLVRKAASIRPSGMVGNWLYGVAHRTALEARRSAAKRRVKEAQAAPRTETPDDTLAHLRPLLDQELTRLPDKYRAVLVQCDLEGRTRKEAAQQLGLPEGTIASRQARGRTLLAKRLTRPGVTVSGGALAVVSAQEAASAFAPLPLVYATVRAATAYAAGPATVIVSAPVAALTEGVLKAMLLSKLKITALLLVVIGVAGTGWGHYRMLASDQPTVQGVQQLVAQADPKQPKTVFLAQEKGKNEDGKKTPDEKKPSDQHQTKQVLDMVLKGYQAYWDSKGKKPADQDLAKLLWDMMEKSYRPPDGKKAGPADKEALNQYKEVFLKAFQLSYEIAYEMAKAKAKGQTKTKPAEAAVFDAYGAAFVQAYERAKTLKKTLQEQKASGGKNDGQAIEALDVFLKAGQAFEQAVKLRAKNQAIEHVKKEIESALSRVEKTTHDQRTALEALEEIEKALQVMKKQVKEKKHRK
jgi:RNA polymerase sigma factor (sigma-70 family)